MKIELKIKEMENSICHYSFCFHKHGPMIEADDVQDCLGQVQFISSKMDKEKKKRDCL